MSVLLPRTNIDPTGAAASTSLSTTASASSKIQSTIFATSTSTASAANSSTIKSTSSTTTSAASATSSAASKSKPFHWTAASLSVLIILLLALIIGLAMISFFKLRSVKERRAGKAARELEKQLNQREGTDTETLIMAASRRVLPLRSMKSRPTTLPSHSSINPIDERIENEQPMESNDLTSPVALQQATAITYQRASINQINSNNTSRTSSPSNEQTPLHRTPSPRRQTSFERSILPPSGPPVPPKISTSALSAAQPSTSAKQLRETFSSNFDSESSLTTPVPAAKPPVTSSVKRKALARTDAGLKQSTHDTRRGSAVIVAPSSRAGSVRNESAHLEVVSRNTPLGEWPIFA